MPNITHADIRMYTMGTGDCFVLKFFSDTVVKLTMMIDAGVWSGSEEHLQPYVKDLLTYVNNKVDILVVTHEHKDHVHVFDVCGDVFTKAGFEAGEIWMAWTENEKLKKIKDWKQKYGDRKKALGMAATALQEAVQSGDYRKQFDGNLHGMHTLQARQNFAEAIQHFADLHATADANNLYIGGLKGMDFAKTGIKTGRLRYFTPGEMIKALNGIEGFTVYVLGPPTLYENVSEESGGEDESYEHNNVLQQSGAFGMAVQAMTQPESVGSLLPFDDSYVSPPNDDVQKEYDNYDWRKIDFDWLYSAGSLALRMNSLTNNLSLVLALEFEKSGRVLFFPGDAEYGSWASWHNIKWKTKGRDGKTPLTEDLLNRTVFYKVAHHSSHNGTAKRLGLDMMTDKDLAAMITLDYGVIPPAWLSTMPNRELLKDLLEKTKGRVMILNDKKVFYDFHKKVLVSEKVEEAKGNMTKQEAADFATSYQVGKYYKQYTVRV